MAKPLKSIEDATSIVPEAVADSVVGEAQILIGEDFSDAREVANRLADKMRQLWANSPDYRKKLSRSGDRGLDMAYAFAEHWLAALIKKEDPKRFQKLPRGYGWNWRPDYGR